jgi:D-inositol-3-phosphate glycosyltransferase
VIKDHPLKIIIIGSAFPFRGGLAAYNERLSLALKEAGHDATIYTFTIQYPSFLFPGKTQFSEGRPPKNISIERKINSINPFNWIKIGMQLKKQKPDLLIFKFWLPFMGPCFGTIARFAKKNHHTKTLTILDNVLPHEKRFGDKFFTRYFLSSSDSFIGMSKKVMEDLLEFDSTKPRALNPHPLFDYGKLFAKNEAKKILGLDENRNYILFFGFIRHYKGLDLIIHAMNEERVKALPLSLIVAGEFYEDDKKYYDLIKTLNIEDKLILHTHFIPDENVGLYFSAAGLIVQPYRSATQSGVTQIAYHFGKPMLVTNVGGLPELVENEKAGYVVSPDSKEIADAIADFYLNNREGEMKKNVEAARPRFLWSTMIETIEKLAAIPKKN